MRRTRLAVTAVLTAAVLAGCGGEDATPQASTAPSTSPAAEPTPSRGPTKDGVTVTTCGPGATDTAVEFSNAGKDKADFTVSVNFVAAGGGELGKATATTKSLKPGGTATTNVTPVGNAPEVGSFTCEIATVVRKPAK